MTMWSYRRWTLSQASVELRMWIAKVIDCSYTYSYTYTCVLGTIFSYRIRNLDDYKYAFGYEERYDSIYFSCGFGNLSLVLTICVLEFLGRMHAVDMYSWNYNDHPSIRTLRYYHVACDLLMIILIIKSDHDMDFILDPVWPHSGCEVLYNPTFKVACKYNLFTR